MRDHRYGVGDCGQHRAAAEWSTGTEWKIQGVSTFGSSVFFSESNNDNPSRMHHWSYICLDIVPPWFVYNYKTWLCDFLVNVSEIGI